MEWKFVYNLSLGLISYRNKYIIITVQNGNESEDNLTTDI